MGLPRRLVPVRDSRSRRFIWSRHRGNAACDAHAFFLSSWDSTDQSCDRSHAW